MQEGAAVLQLDHVQIANGAFRLEAHLEIIPGTKVAVMGPSGAGKSTLVNGVAGFHDVTSGSIRWNGSSMTELPPGKRPVAMLFQDGNLFPHMSARDNVGLGVHPNLKLSAPDWTCVDQALARVGLGDLAARRPAELSGGQQSRAALARVLVQAKPILILDEPFSALGPALKIEMLDFVAELTAETGATLLMVTHDPEDAARLADVIVHVSDRRAHPPEEAQAMLRDPPPALRAYLGDG